jgi:hypothetical protein
MFTGEVEADSSLADVFLINLEGGEVFSRAQDADGNAMLSLTLLGDTLYVAVRSLHMLRLHLRIGGTSAITRDLASLLTENPNWQQVILIIIIITITII